MKEKKGLLLTGFILCHQMHTIQIDYPLLEIPTINFQNRMKEKKNIFLTGFIPCHQMHTIQIDSPPT